MKNEAILQNLSDLENKSLLIVDDDNPFRERLARAMEKKGFNVTQAESVEKAISEVRLNNPAFAVIDLRLNDGNGLEIVKEIQIPVQGGMDPKVLLTDKDNLKKEALKYLDIFKDHPYIFNLGHGVLPETDPNMMDYLVKTVKNY